MQHKLDSSGRTAVTCKEGRGRGEKSTKRCKTRSKAATKRDVRPGKHIQGRKRRETVDGLGGGGGERLENEGGDEVKYVA